MDKNSQVLPQFSPGDVLPTCSAACPVHTDTREYVQRLSRGDYEGALDILLAVNPFPSVCGRICHHPCESKCRRTAIDEAVSLRMLKRFIVENTREYRIARRKKAAVKSEKTVAVIGSGPSGLTAAMDLTLRGYRVRVYEKDARLGGMLAHAVPRYRLPPEALAEDIEDILATGVEVHYGCCVGVDISFERLRQENDAVLIAVGLSESHSLPIPGTGSKGVFLGVTFLWDVANGLCPELGERVVVIGGGNVAIDIARAAKRLGPLKKVYLACLEKREEMPAWKSEITEAEEEGIEILNSWAPKAIVEKEGAVAGVAFKRCTDVFDDQRRFSPAYDESVTTDIEVESVILAIGQKANLDFLAGAPVAVSRGRLLCDTESMATSERGVFACGEVMTGPGSAIQAVATGHDAAGVISRYLETGEVHKLLEKKAESIGELPAATAALARRIERVCVDLTDPAERIKNFTPIEPVYTEEEALSESRRCLACATGARLHIPNHCAGCLTCARVCPFGVAQVRGRAFIPPQQCQTCGLCAAECPACAIEVERFPASAMKKAMADSVCGLDLGRVARPFLVSYCCVNGTTSRKYLREQPMEEIRDSGILRVMVPCVGRLSRADLLSPFELGADKVAVISCPEEGCFYPRVEELLLRRIKRMQKYLDEIGVGADKLRLFHMAGSGDESWPRIWEEFRAVNMQTAVGR